MPTTAPVATQNPWLHPISATQPPSLSDRLIRALEAHAAAETADIADCERLAQSSADPAVRLLMGLIVEDEQRHHALLQRMVRRLQEEVEFTPSNNAIPVPTTEAEPVEIIETLRALIRDEQAGARYLRHLARQEPDVYGGLYTVLLETMARDSEKHAHVLRYLLRRLESTARAS